jgi:hypothetical protein
MAMMVRGMNYSKKLVMSGLDPVSMRHFSLRCRSMDFRIKSGNDD